MFNIADFVVVMMMMMMMMIMMMMMMMMMMLYARSGTDFAGMVESLVEELADVGLHLNTSKTKMLTTQNLKEQTFFDICGHMIEVLHEAHIHKYLGKKLSDDLRNRAMVDLQQRSQIARMKFNEHRHGDTLLNRCVFEIALQVFDITLTILFGVWTYPLASNHLQQLEVVRNHMLRSIVGRASLADNNWHELKMHSNFQC